jgi:hypothetical protein
MAVHKEGELGIEPRELNGASNAAAYCADQLRLASIVSEHF